MNSTCNDILWLIFCAIPLKELVPLRVVCHQWDAIIRKFCRTQKSLLLCSQSKASTYLHAIRSFLPPKSLNQRLFPSKVEDTQQLQQALTFLLPKVTTLAIVDDFYVPDLLNTPFIVSLWSHSLTSLTIHGLSPGITTLTQSLNSLHSLRELNLLYVYNRIDLEKVTIWQQLEQFSLVRYNGDILPVLTRLGRNFKHLKLDNVQLTSDQLIEALAQNAQLTTGLKYLSIGPLCVTEKQHLRPVLKTITSSRFYGLTYLFADFAFQLPFEEVLSQMAQLPQLTELKLNFGCDFESALQKNFRAYAPLHSVSKLHLNLYHSSITMGTFVETFVRFFPALKQIEVRCDQPHFIDQLEQCIFGLFPALCLSRLSA